VGCPHDLIENPMPTRAGAKSLEFARINAGRARVFPILGRRTRGIGKVNIHPPRPYGGLLRALCGKKILNRKARRESRRRAAEEVRGSGLPLVTASAPLATLTRAGAGGGCKIDA